MLLYPVVAVGAVGAYGVAVQQDLQSRIIPDFVSVALIFFAVLRWVATGDLSDVGWDLVAAGIVFAVTLALFVMGYFGGGDVKLLTASILLLGATNCIAFIVAVALGGGIVSLFVLLWYRLKWWRKRYNKEKIAIERKEITVPYGMAIALPGIWFILTQPMSG